MACQCFPRPDRSRTGRGRLPSYSQVTAVPPPEIRRPDSVLLDLKEDIDGNFLRRLAAVDCGLRLIRARPVAIDIASGKAPQSVEFEGILECSKVPAFWARPKNPERAGVHLQWAWLGMAGGRRQHSAAGISPAPRGPVFQQNRRPRTAAKSLRKRSEGPWVWRAYVNTYREERCLFSTQRFAPCLSVLTFVRRVHSHTFNLKEASAPRASWRVNGL